MPPNIGPVPRVLGFSPGHEYPVQYLCDVLEGSISAGLRALVIRERDRPTTDLERLIDRLKPLIGTGLILHASHPDAIEMAVQSNLSLHLPSHLSADTYRHRIRGWLGQSCHTDAELQRAEDSSCDYATLSPIFPPVSKPHDARETLGAKGLAIRADRFQIPIFALGGITVERAAVCIRVGCHGIASMGTLFPPKSSPSAAYHATRLLLKSIHSEQ